MIRGGIRNDILICFTVIYYNNPNIKYITLLIVYFTGLYLYKLLDFLVIGPDIIIILDNNFSI